MNVNDDAVPIILALLDQLYGLRRELRTIATARWNSLMKYASN